MVTLRPLDFSKRPRAEAVRPLPRELDTPPVTKTNLAIVKPSRQYHAHRYHARQYHVRKYLRQHYADFTFTVQSNKIRKYTL